MSDQRPVRAILVKGRLPPQGAAFTLSGAPLGLARTTFEFTSRPLFTSIGRDGALGIAAAPSTWHIAEAAELDAAHGWDVCHALAGSGLGLAGSAVEFAEPDLQQQWTFGEDAAHALRAAGGCDEIWNQDGTFPPHPADDAHPLWYRDAEHSNFAGGAGDGAGICIAHLDTGISPHDTQPVNLRADLQRNFVDANFPNDATDRSPTSGLLNLLGHGTATIAILAGAGAGGGAPIGAAPGASVVPVRVANGVVLFSNSSVAQGFDYVHALLQDPATRVHVVTMSMGGLASQAWADAINALYEAGVFVVTAAGNNHGNLPTRNIVYPARFRRVVAATGAMSDFTPYADQRGLVMAGNYGPASKMDTALAAFSPNTPWARIGCPHTVDHNGSGTSSTSPQIAAAAALYWQAHHAALDDPAQYPEAWMRIEAVRAALFGAAARKTADVEHFGQGTLRALEALAIAPPASATLKKQPPDSASFALLRIFTGLGLAAAAGSPQQRMLEVEALQLSQSAALEALLPDPEQPPDDPKQRAAVAEALASDPHASQALRDALKPLVTGQIHPVATPAATPLSAMDKLHLEHAMQPQVSPPGKRRLRVYAYDPALEVQLETYAINQAVVDVRWEGLEPGPVGEYIEVVDVDPSSRCCYAPVDLDDPYVLVQNGRAPAESDAQFHQQMVYAVAMKTIEHFEHALGRVALWSPHATGSGTSYAASYVQRLRIYPHALREANAYYSPDKKALLLGYFPAQTKNVGVNAPGTLVFGCLSYDIVAHETTHALLDGLHRRYSEQTNPDVLAFHEAMADIVALFQHFTLPEALRDQIAKTRGDLTQENLLSELAYQFGQAEKGHGALRDALGHYDDTGTWIANKPTGEEYMSATEPHDRGSVLVAAVFDAFLRIYRIRCADLFRLASAGTGVLPPGNIPHDLVERLAQEASKVAKQWLDICIRALDYCPPVDPTFGDYLRALITADRDLVPDDDRSYRIAFISAFRDRGIFAQGVRYLAERSLAWEPPPQPFKNLKHILARMTLNWDLDSKRREAYDTSNHNAALFHGWLMSDDVSKDELDMLCLYRGGCEDFEIVKGIPGTLANFEVHSVRPARRIGPDDQTRTQLIVEITQTWRSPGYNDYRGGVTLIVDLVANEVRYVVRKRVDSEARFRAQQGLPDAGGATALSDGEEASLHDNYYDPRNVGREPFAMLHRSSATMVGR
ncbi:MAG: S8 family serine peptidase [Candidatus Eremiobacteraeota bacterium]|nr:S8 family serine peptidase [Candidatus Eremiobacteraeota bacterium]